MFSARTTQTLRACRNERCDEVGVVVSGLVVSAGVVVSAGRRQSALCVWLASNARVAA